MIFVELKEASLLLYGDLLKNQDYIAAIDIVKKRSSGKIWLIGSGIYKSLINIFYDAKYKIKDWDFIVENINVALGIDNNLEIYKNNHGNFKLNKNGLSIDLIPLNNIHSIKERNLEPNITNYLSGTPFSIQAMAFDVSSHELLGKNGLVSIINKTIEVNNQDELTYARGLYGDKYLLDNFSLALGFQKVDKV